MKITIVIPTYQRPQLLMRCVQALANQTFDKRDYEIIVVTDGPDTETRETIELFALNQPLLNIRCLSTPVKGGPAAARNLGWRNGLADFIAFTDDDTIPDPSWLSAFWEARMIAGPLIAFTGQTVVPISNPPTDYELNISHLERAEFITANCACSRSALEITGGFDEQFTMAWREDSDLHFKLLKNSIEIRKVNEAIVTHPVRKHKWAVSLRDEKKGIFNVLLYKKYPELYRQRIGTDVPVNYYIIVVALLLMIAGTLFGVSWIVLPAFLVWLTLTLAFTYKRLRGTSRSTSHVMEMFVTSIFIPPLSLYYRWYGALKYRVLLP